jgi:AcrR family transcriptional regulator
VGGDRSDVPVALSAVERIRAAALKSFAANGTSGTTLRSVAAAAGVSLGLVQHHFVTKAGLIKAVEDHVLETLVTAMARPIPEPPADSISDVGSRVTRIIAEQPEVADYVGRAVMDGTTLGATVFDTLMGVGMARWRQRAERGEARPDVDLPWAVMNAMVLALGALALRPHIDRHLPASLTTPEQLQRWQTSVDTLLREGLLRPPPDA